MQNNEENIVKYAVDDNLFRLESTNPKKIQSYSPPILDAFWWGVKRPTKTFEQNFFFQFFFFKSVQIYMKDAEFAESKEKSYIRFLFFELWSVC